MYSQLEGASHVVNTAWAMMALMSAGHHEVDAAPLHRCAVGGVAAGVGEGGGFCLAAAARRSPCMVIPSILIACLPPAPSRRAARFLMSAQLPSGDWPQQHISGVFNRNCMITYANYR